MRNCCDSKDWMTDAKRCSCSTDGAKADRSSEDLFELVVVGVLASAEEEILDTAAAPDFLPILKLCDGKVFRCF